ncbi:sugar ABC transporter ATP-binding protein [Oceanicola granulosus HTCC2516]|uniref:Sugar ABC transporter ATP-binding protein n=1 Tax=Oceanicola granulosus (strain ATCC BAA-861 / DSM 15982 / KCTC 12143 / HTCC2516) TaxID=314256 RepID=Q2CH78_OCEGH|nr:ABC transporter ATP-binding protein [Oceanicola granulosus]EAR51933.1 sugar ABC transporter ATP-binding protein [Oceanicola granulosus HTCC2516]
MSEPAPVIEMRNVVKRFGDFTAIHDANIDLRPGEIHALVGENGAGKSTLMNVLYGLLPRSGGEVLLRGEPVDYGSPNEAIAAGIGMVPQHFKLANSFTVAENIILGSEPTRGFNRLDRRRAAEETAEISRRFGLEVQPGDVVGDLAVGLRQQVEILKTLYRKAEVLIFDEPTAVLTPQETRELFNTMRNLAAAGNTIVFITHKLGEVLAVSDRISVMKQGRIVATLDNRDVTAQQIAALMVGRSVILRVDKAPPSELGAPLLRIRDLCARGERGEVAVDNLSLDVRAGEIVGLAGVQGNGQDELVECIAGLRRRASGDIEICGKPTGRTPGDNRDLGLAYVPADRAHVGLSLESGLWENLSIGHLESFRWGPFMRTGAARKRAGELIERFDVRGGEIDKFAGSLSGGNQQKVQIARELTRPAPLIIAEQPSQGVDIGAIESIHRILVEMRDAGRAVFVISADLDEIFSISDRILVIYRGRIVADLAAEDTDQEEVGRYMGGLEDRPRDGASPERTAHVG